jgi:hypothetical protein
MSANNWRICPKCSAASNAAASEARKKTKEAYGCVSSTEYGKMVQQIKDWKSPGETLREDYELGVQKNGVFSVAYFATCTECGWSFEYRFETKTDACRD